MSAREKTFHEELDKLIEEGERLLLSLQKKPYSTNTENKYKEPKNNSVNYTQYFINNYQQWYSKACLVVEKILPLRFQDFLSYYEYKEQRNGINKANYRIYDFLHGIPILALTPRSTTISVAPHFQQQLGILKAAKEMLSSKLLDLKALVQADLFDSEIDAAKELAKKGFLKETGAICGVIIEKHLHSLCERHNITITKKDPGISDLCAILRSNDIIDLPQERFIMSCADIRNICDHYKKIEVTQTQIDNLLNDTKRIIDTIY